MGVGTLGGLYGNLGQSGNGFWNGVYLGGGLPGPSTTSNAPTYDMNTPYGQMALGMTTNAGGAGWGANGVGAFMPRGWSLPSLRQLSMDDTGDPYNWGGTVGGNSNAFTDLYGLASTLGMDTSKYDLSNPMSLVGGPHQTQPSGGWDSLFSDMNNQLKNYYAIAGMSSGWDGGKNPRSAAQTLYYNDNNVLRPVSDPTKYTAPEKKGGWLQNEGSELLAAMSVALPAFGGWGGILGQGTAGTLSANAGLGLTTGLGNTIGTGAANALTNAAVGSALNGGGAQGFLGSLFQQGLGAGYNSLTGGSNGLGNLFNTSGAGVSNLNPFGYFQQVGRGIGMGGTPIGQSGSLLNIGRGLGQLFGR